MILANIFDYELQALKFMLMNRTGCSSFTNLRTIDGTTYSTFQQAQFEFKVAHELKDDYYVSASESREDDFFFQIILDYDIIDHFIENYRPETTINETNYTKHFNQKLCPKIFYF